MHRKTLLFTSTILIVLALMLGSVTAPAAAKSEYNLPTTATGFPCVEFYTVKSGDTLWKITQAYKIHPLILIWINGLDNPDILYPGDQVCVKVPVKVGTFHSVAPGDTLTSISNTYEKEWDYLAMVNALSNPDFIWTGQVLFIPSSKTLEIAR